MENVLELVEARGAEKVLRVRLAIGELTCVQLEQLKFCYESVTSETPLAGSELDIEAIPARVTCSRCGYEGPPKYWMDYPGDTPVPTLQCPGCGLSAEPAQGHECIIKLVQYGQEAAMP